MMQDSTSTSSYRDGAPHPEEIQAMMEARRTLDNLLQNLASSVASSETGPYRPRLPNEGALLILTKQSLESIADTVQSAQNRKELIEVLSRRQYLPVSSQQQEIETAPSLSLSIPSFLLYPHSRQPQPETIDLPTLTEISSDLATSSKHILVNGIDGPLAFETDAVDEEYLLDNIDEGLYDEELKRNDHDAWMKKLGDYRLKCLLRRISLIVADADLSLSQQDIDIYAVSALRRAAALDVDLCWEDAQTAIELLFGLKNCDSELSLLHGNIIVKACKKRGTSIRCHVGSWLWEKGRYGIGMAVEMEAQFELHWKPKPQAPSSSEVELDDNTFVGHTFIKIIHRQALDHLDIDGSCSSGTIVIDPDQIDVSIIIDVSNDDKSVPTQALGCSRIGIPLSEVVSNMSNGNEADSDSVQGNAINDPFNGRLSTELYVWGGSVVRADDQSKQTPSPTKVPVFQLTPLERIASVVCSDTHALCLTSLGIVYSCGGGSDGQLGRGNVAASLNTFRPIEWFLTKSLNIVQISAGSDRLSSHSAAISADGALYTWGRATVCGHVGYGPSLDDVLRGEGSERGTGSHSAPIPLPTIDEPKRVETLKGFRVLQVSCGGSFTLARVCPRDGCENALSSPIHVFSWGLLSSGRCGTGPRKLEVDASYLHAGTRQKKAPIYQLRPARITSFDNKSVCDVSAGKSHGLAVSSCGELYAWGRNSEGQCGLSATRSSGLKGQSVFDDVFSPQRVDPFGNASGPTARIPSAGASTSAVIDTDGRLWTWGGGGGRNCALLGHGEVGDGDFEYISNDGATIVLPASGRSMTETALLSGFLRSPSWCTPRKVNALEGSVTTKVAMAGCYGLAVVQTGDLYVWGENTRTSSSRSNAVTCFEDLVATPTLPWPQWRHDMSIESVSSVAASAGMGVIFITDGPAVCNDVGAALLKQCCTTSDSPRDALVDCCIVVSTGQRLYCHKVIVSCRSTALRLMLQDEERLEDNSDTTVELLMPELQHEVAQGLLQYIYTDSICASHVSTPMLTFSLMEAADRLGLSNLVEICRKRLDDEADGEGSLRIEESSLLVESTFAQDVGTMLDECSWSDVNIVTGEGKVIRSHWCLLSARGSYFHKLYVSSKQTATSIKVTECYENIVRLLRFVYTGEVLGQGNGELVEDLRNAHKYGVSGMKLVVESLIHVTSDTAVELYELALRTGSKQLEQEALRVMSTHLKPAINPSPQFMHSIFQRIKDRSIYSAIPRARIESALLSMKLARERQVERRRKEEQQLVGGDEGMMSVPVFIGLGLSVVGYIALQNAVAGGPVIFVMNIVFLGVSLRFALQQLQ